MDTAASRRGKPGDTVYAAHFGPGLTGNIGMLRRYLPSSGLLARAISLPVTDAGPAAILYREGRAAPAVVRLVRRWVAKHLGQDEARRGDLAGRRAVFGLLPRFEATRWLDRTAMLLDAGYVVVLVDRMSHAYIAQMAPPIRLHQVFSRTGEIGVHPFGAAIGINRQVAGLSEAPHVSGVVLFEGEAISGDEDYRDPQVRRRVEASAAANMQRQIDSVLAKLSEWQADPVGFGLLFRGRFPTWQAWERYHWSEQVARLRADIRATMRIRRYGLTMGPGPEERGD